ncbi:MAG: type II toxin-antitoxin system VapC family toxin [Sporichthyaceae bacterium]
MIVLDTNVVSEMMRDVPDPVVAAWFARQPSAVLRLTSVTVGEVAYGIERMPPGRRREALAGNVARIATALETTVLSYDRRAAEIYGPLLAARETKGRPMSTADAQIAAICTLHGAVLATRNRSDFEDTGVDLVDPWAG